MECRRGGLIRREPFVREDQIAMDSRVRRAFKLIAQAISSGPPHKFRIEWRPFCFYACISTLLPFIYTGRKNLPNIFISPEIFYR